ncbi:MAG: methylenetetrahydrofolate reductase [Ignavibacteriales bacterium]|nr:methylenetetrahydrofolate reductase [Ignavibacteriales bacterium]
MRLVGGCCGTTPGAHPPASRTPCACCRPARPGWAWRRWRRRPPRPGIPPRAPRCRATHKSRLAHDARARRLRRAGRTRAAARARLRDARRPGAHAEDPRGRRDQRTRQRRASGPPTSALATAILIEQRAGVETLLHYTCRDRNLLGMQSDLLGAHAMGLRNLLITTGNPPIVGDYPQATGVFDVDSIGLANVVTRLNHGLDVGGASVGAPTSFHLGVAVSPTALDPELEVKRFAYKAEAGAEFAVTQAVFDVETLKALLARIAHAQCPDHRRGLGVRVAEGRRVHGQRSPGRARARRPRRPDAPGRRGGARAGGGRRHRARNRGRGAAARERGADWNGGPPVLVRPWCAGGHSVKMIRTSSSEWREHLVFLGALVRNPRSVGAIVPSSVQLAKKIAKS